uniref:Hydroxy-delta-5-steroid dehydrogenase, 3 beta- and steroid delta-isomerase n=1 Tax=Salarias fasciatus TaxID=181472 RepID=A0A672GWR9_SALFA
MSPVYLLTGGCSFLGKHLLEVLLQQERELAEIRSTGDVSSCLCPSEKTKVVVIQGDITDYSSVLEATRGVDVVIHSASLVDVCHRILESAIYAVNVTGTKNVIQACVECGVERLVYTSSMDVIGPNMNGDHFLRGNEDTPYVVKHTMAYPKSKTEAEKIVLRPTVRGGKRLYTCSLRPTGIYGEGLQTGTEMMKDFYKQTVQQGGVVIGGIPDHIEHGRVYAGTTALGGEAFFCYDDSPYKSYEDFNMMLLSVNNFRKSRMPFLLLWFLALFNDVMRWILSPVYNYTPLLNRYTLAVASTTFTVGTDKARRYFQYSPLYDWDQCLARTQKWISTFHSEKPKET